MDIADGGVGSHALDGLGVILSGKGDGGGPGLGACGQGVVGQVFAVIDVQPGLYLVGIDLSLDEELAVLGVVIDQHDLLQSLHIVLQDGALDPFQGGKTLLVGQDLLGNVQHIVHHGAGILDEGFDDGGVTAAAGAGDILVNDLAQVVLLDAVLLGKLGVVSANILAVPVKEVGVLLLQDHHVLASGLHGAQNGLGAGVAHAHNNGLHVHGLVRGQTGGFAQPVAGTGVTLDTGACGGGIHHGDLHALALGLGDTGGGRLLYGLACDGGAGNGVNIGALGVQEGLLQVLSLGLANVFGLAGQVQLHIGDAVGVKGHGDGDLRHTGGGGTVGAGGIETLVFRGGGGGGLLVLAGAQHAHGGDPRDSCGGALEEVSAAQIFAQVYSSFLTKN